MGKSADTAQDEQDRADLLEMEQVLAKGETPLPWEAVRAEHASLILTDPNMSARLKDYYRRGAV